MFLFPIIFTIRYVDNFFKKPIYNAHNIPNFIFNAFLYFIFSSERYLIMFFNLPFGVSIFCVAQKNLGFSKLTN
jgi:hypothetical protein